MAAHTLTVNAMDHEKATPSGDAMVRVTMTKIALSRPTDGKSEFPCRYPIRPKKSS